MSTPTGGFDPQPCCGSGAEVSEVTIVGPLPVPVDVVSPDPLNVNVVNQLSEPLDVNVVSPNPLPVTGTVAVSGTVPVTVSGPNPLPVSLVTPNPVPVTGSVTAVVSPNPLPVTGTVGVSGTVPVTISGPNPLPVTGTITATPGGSTAASATLTTATTGNGTTVDFTSAKAHATLVILVNGTVTSGVVDLQGSHDGTNWVKIASSGALATGVNQSLTMDGGAYRWFRGVVSENVAGGGSVTGTLMFA